MHRENESMKARKTTLLGGRVSFLQAPKGGYRTGIDPIFLAAALPVFPTCSVLDLGCGSGAAILCLAAICPFEIRITGIDNDVVALDLARRNIALNSFAQKNIWLTKTDIAWEKERLCAAIGGNFDYVMTNPPFYKKGSTVPPRDAGRMRAHCEEGADLSCWVRTAYHMLAEEGALLMIYPKQRCDDLLQALHLAGFGRVELVMLKPKQEREEKRFLALARKKKENSAEAPLFHDAFILHQPSGEWTAQARAILYDGGVHHPWRNSKILN